MKKSAASCRAAGAGPAQITLEAALLEPVPPPVPHQNGMAVSVVPSGHVTLIQRLCEAVTQKIPLLRVEFSAYRDRTRLLLRPSEAGPYKFPKSGRIKDTAFTRSLVNAGIALPARYTVAWNPSLEGWVGVLDTQAQLTAGQALFESLRSQQKKDGKRGV